MVKVRTHYGVESYGFQLSSLGPAGQTSEEESAANVQRPELAEARESTDIPGTKAEPVYIGM